MAAAKGTRFRGNLIDSITLVKFDFQWEPKHTETSSTKFGSVPIIGKRLPVRQWIGEGDDAVEITIYLNGPSLDIDNVTPEDIAARRQAQAVAYNKRAKELRGTGVEPAKAVREPADVAREKILQERRDANKFVVNQLKILKAFKEPQDDTGAPHPLFLNMGATYSGRKFVLESIETDFITHSMFYMQPVEAEVKLKLLDVTDYRKV